MNNQTLLLVVIALLIGAAGGYIIADRDAWSGARGQHMTEYDSVPMGMHRMPDGSLMGSAGPIGMGPGHMMDMMVTSERQFIEGMIPHHQEAIDTANEVLERGGTTPEIRALAENIIAAQATEIAAMKEWYEAWYGEPYTDTDSYEPMMRELDTLSGAELDQVFLTDMIMHHMGAIMMARSVQPYIEHQEIEELTSAIVTTQLAEINEMRELLAEL